MTSVGAREAATFELVRAVLRATLSVAEQRACTVNVLELVGPRGPVQRISLLYQRRAASEELPLREPAQRWHSAVEAATHRLLAQVGLGPQCPAEGGAP